MNALRKVSLAPPNLLTMVYLLKMQDEKMDVENGKEPDANKKKKKCLLLCCLLTLFFHVYPQGDLKNSHG